MLFLAPGSSQFDPHFMITDPITKEHLCFDYTGSNNEVVELVTDESSGITFYTFKRLMVTKSQVHVIQNLA